jgi:hypothetical protein
MTATSFWILLVLLCLNVSFSIVGAAVGLARGRRDAGFAAAHAALGWGLATIFWIMVPIPE